jgi:hypothetical protein
LIINAPLGAKYSLLKFFEAQPQKNLDQAIAGKAKPFRTSGGEAAALILTTASHLIDINRQLAIGNRQRQ